MQVFELLAQCMNESPERRPHAPEAAHRLQRILERGDFVSGKYVASKSLKLTSSAQVCFGAAIFAAPRSKCTCLPATLPPGFIHSYQQSHAFSNTQTLTQYG